MNIDPQQLQILEHKERLLAERLKQNLTQQDQLRQKEGEFRCEMQRIENEKYSLLKTL